MAVRRSARLRSQSVEDPQPQAETIDHNKNNDDDNTHQSSNENIQKLPSVEEHDEPSNTTEDTKTMKTPVRNSGASKTPEKKSTGKKTPSSIVAPRPTMGEMHPSKVHQSTTKKADSGLLLGFNPVKKDANGNVVKDSVAQDTPTKARASPTSQYGTPGFEFKFASQESQLSDEAQKLMESLRSDAARIKAQIVEENKDKPAEEGRDKDQRKIAMPKGIAGRYSNAHMAQFKKMDSIANHPSAFRATPGRFQPVVETGSSKTLKRTKSKARLDEPESQNNTSPSKPSPAPAVSGAKRVKQGKTDDASTRRPASEEKSQAAPAPPSATPRRSIQPPRARSSVRSSLMTPTKASMARANSASVKPPKKPSMIPAPTQSPAGKVTMVTPRTPQTEFNPRLKTSLPSFANLKSILRRRQPLFSKDPSKIASGTHSAAPDFTPDLLLGSSNGQDDAAQTPSPKKRVGFSPSVKSPREQPPASPSPSKIPTSASARSITYPTLPALTPEGAKSKAPTVRHVAQADDNDDQQSGPEVPGVMHGINNKKRHRVEPDNDAASNTENMPPAETTPNNERSAKRVKLGTPIKVQQPPTPTPVKGRVHPPSSNTPLRTGGRGSTAGTPASARKSRGFVTSNRLNMLAQPKHR